MKIYGLTIIKNAISQNYPIAEVMLQHQGLFDVHIIGVASENNDETRQLVENTAWKCENEIVIKEIEWPNKDVAWTEESLDKKLEVQLEKFIPENEWIIKVDADEALHEKDFAEIKELATAFYTSDVDVIAFNYLPFIGSLATAYKDSCHYAARMWKNGKGYYGHNDAMTIVPNKMGTVHWVDHIYLYHFGYLKSKDLLTQKLKEHYTLNKSVLRPIDAEQIEWKWPDHVVGAVKSEVLFDKVEYIPVKLGDIPKEFRDNKDKFNFYIPWGD